MKVLFKAIFSILILNHGCGVASRMHTYSAEEAIVVASDTDSPMYYGGLKQVVAFQEFIISGAKPEGRVGFESLMKMDVSMIVCVDGVTPDVKTAQEYGIKTVHIPLKYEAPTDEQIFDLTTVVSRIDRGNVYIHCHQGKHRSAAAAAIVSIALGSLTLDEAKERMEVSQTSHEYKGLWEAVEQTTVINVFDLLLNEKAYPSIVEPTGLMSQMIAMNGAMDNLIRIQNSNWKAPIDHPDLVGAAEAGMIADTFRNIQLGDEANAFSVDFETLLVNAIRHASSLEDALLQRLPMVELDVYIQRVEHSCMNCHAAFRK
jgi:hypothetical protein